MSAAISRRRALALGAGAAAAAASSGCSAQKWGARSSAGTTKHLTYALWDANQQVGYQKSIDVFQRMHPNIRVTIQQIPYGSYQAKINAEFISGEAPDLFWVNTPFLADWIQRGILADITDRVSAAGIDLSIYYPALVALHRRDGRLYGLPKDWDTIAFYYNKTLTKKRKVEVPESLTWHPYGSGTFTPFLQQLTIDRRGRDAATTGFDPRHVTTYATSIYNDLQAGFGSFLAMNGGGVLARPYDQETVLTSARNAETMTWLTQTLRSQHVLIPADSIGLNANGAALSSLFAQGVVATYLAGDWNTNSLYQLTQGGSGLEVGVLPLPSGPQGRISVFNGLTDGVNAHSNHPDEAWLLAQWLAGPESQTIMGSGGYIWPAIRSLDPLFLKYWESKGIDVSPFLDEATGKTINFPVSEGMGNAITNIQTTLGPVFLGTASPAAGLASAKRIADYNLSNAAKY